MNWEAVLSVSLVLLGLLALLMPFYALIRWPGAFTPGFALGLMGASVAATLLLTIALTAAFQGLTGLIPGLNPYRPPAYEAVDGGLFGLFVGLQLSLLLVCVGQGLLIRSRLQKYRRQA